MCPLAHLSKFSGALWARSHILRSTSKEQFPIFLNFNFKTFDTSLLNVNMDNEKTAIGIAN